MITLNAGTSGFTTHARTAAKRTAQSSVKALTGTNSISSSPAGCTLSFGPSRAFAAGSGPTSLVSADFNGDGTADLAVANFDSSDVSILLGKGDGTFTGTVNNYGTGSGPRSITPETSMAMPTSIWSRRILTPRMFQFC
jgi:hypothetical protein